MVAKFNTASKVTPFNGSLYGLTSVENFVAYIVSFYCTGITQHCTVSLEVVAKNFLVICMPWVSIWYMSRYLRYVPLYGHRKRFCHKFMLISNNRVQTQHFQNGVLKPYGTNWKHYYQGFHNANVCLFRKQCVFWWWGRLQFQPCNNLFFFFKIIWFCILVLYQNWWVAFSSKVYV